MRERKTSSSRSEIASISWRISCATFRGGRSEGRHPRDGRRFAHSEHDAVRRRDPRTAPCGRHGHAVVSAFRDLLKQAHDKGIREMRFEVDLVAFFADDQAESWHAEGTEDRILASGRTGEEALRHYVERLP